MSAKLLLCPKGFLPSLTVQMETSIGKFINYSDYKHLKVSLCKVHCWFVQTPSVQFGFLTRRQHQGKKNLSYLEMQEELSPQTCALICVAFIGLTVGKLVWHQQVTDEFSDVIVLASLMDCGWNGMLLYPKETIMPTRSYFICCDIYITC